MTDLMPMQTRFRKQLLSTVSALALIGFVSDAKASGTESSRPAVWIELGGQFDSLSDPAQTWMPPDTPPPLVQPAFEPLGKMPRIGYDVDGKISFQPTGSDWTLSAAIHYGKAKLGPKSTHDQDNPSGYNIFYSKAPPTYAYTDSHSVSDTKHLILDFQAGKDLGLGLFGSRGGSTLNFGIRMAKFNENADGSMAARISAQFKYSPGIGHYANMRNERSFNGVGPSIAWNGSEPLVGSLEDGIAFDWGASAALLFGRQKTNVNLTTRQVQFTAPFTGPAQPPQVLTHSTSVSIRKKQMIVPNFGGFAGVSYRLRGDAKISFGYRADFYFNAIDGGIQTRKTENRGFFGPFASVSVGIGD